MSGLGSAIFPSVQHSQQSMLAKVTAARQWWPSSGQQTMTLQINQRHPRQGTGSGDPKGTATGPRCTATGLLGLRQNYDTGLRKKGGAQCKQVAAVVVN